VVRAEFDQFQPNVSLIVSGGHTMLVHVESELNHRVLGSTMDDAAGECFDKTGKLLGLAYPAGPIIDRLAEQGNPEAFKFPRPLRNDDNHDFSFSGLKTSVRYFLRDHPGLADDPRQLRDLCASVQAAIVDVLVTKTIRAARKLGVKCVTASGGVTCNRSLRRELAAACARAKLQLRLADASLCTPPWWGFSLNGSCSSRLRLPALMQRFARTGHWSDRAPATPCPPLEYSWVGRDCLHDVREFVTPNHVSLFYAHKMPGWNRGGGARAA
jgi:hypothetical protein